jgi:uncharacterized protein (AIM24 family)
MKGSQFFVVEFSGVGTVYLAYIIAIIHSQEYNVYFRAMRERLAAPDPKGAQGQAIFSAEFSGVGIVWLAHIIAETHSQEYSTYFRTI